MSNQYDSDLSNSADCQKYVDEKLHSLTVRSAEIGQGTLIKRALPSREKRMIGAWCFLDHAGPASFEQGDGLDVGPHPHIGLQTFTWMIEGTVMHTDSIGSKQLIRPNQVNLMTAGYGISHTEVAPDTETKMHAAQLWIALPDEKLNMPPQFDHYPELPVISEHNVKFTVLVGEFLEKLSPVKVHTPLVGVDMFAEEETQITLTLDPKFEYGFLALEDGAEIAGHQLTSENMLILEPGLTHIEMSLPQGARVLMIGGEPFNQPVLLWWNLVGRTTEALREAKEQWENHDPRFGEIEDYDGPRLKAPTFPDRMKASN